MAINGEFRRFPFLKGVSDCSDHSAVGREKRTEDRQAAADSSCTGFEWCRGREAHAVKTDSEIALRFDCHTEKKEGDQRWPLALVGGSYHFLRCKSREEKERN